MARRKRKDDVPDWTAPEFDEVGYMRTEIGAARAAVATIAWALVGAAVSFLLYSVHPALAFFAGILVGFGLYFFLPMIGISIDAFKRRDWTGHGITYFFSWLAFWILLLNPPIGECTSPTILAISVSPVHTGYTGYLACLPLVGGAVTVPLTLGNASVYVLFRATDNVGLASLQVNVTPGGSSQPPFEPTPTPLFGLSRCRNHTYEVYPGGTYSVVFVFAASTYRITIAARDPSGHTAAYTFDIRD